MSIATMLSDQLDTVSQFNVASQYYTVVMCFSHGVRLSFGY